MTKNLLVFIETEKSKIAEVSLEIAAYCAQYFKDFKINGLLLTSEEYKENLINQLQEAGLDNLYINVDSRYNEVSLSTQASAISDFLRHFPQDIFLAGATTLGRELAPRAAAKNNIGLTADCTHIDIDEEGVLLATRPTYGGQLMATIVSKTKPNFATIRPKALKTENKITEKPMNVEFYNPDLNNVIEAVKVLSKENKEAAASLENAQIIIAGGLGLKTKENFDLVIKFAKLIGAQPAASRAAVELGWACPELQVGQTGHTVAPKLYIAFGISGAMQHLVGISNSDRIIAVNTDKNAPIFEFSDIGIVADAPSFLSALIQKLESEG